MKPSITTINCGSTVAKWPIEFVVQYQESNNIRMQTRKDNVFKKN